MDIKVFFNRNKIMNKLEQISDEEAIENYLKEYEYYSKASMIDKIVEELLDEYDLPMPVFLCASIDGMLQSKKVLELKGISIPEEAIEDIQLTRKDVIDGIKRAWVGLEMHLKYYGADQDAFDKLDEKFKDLLENGIPESLDEIMMMYNGISR